MGKILTRHFPDINPRLVFNLSKIISQICVRQSRDLNLIGDVCLQIGQKLDAQAVSKEFSGVAKNVKLKYFCVRAAAGVLFLLRLLFLVKAFILNNMMLLRKCPRMDTVVQIGTILHWNFPKNIAIMQHFFKETVLNRSAAPDIVH